MTENYEKKAGPVVSVLVPTFNRPQYLSKALASVLQQSYRNLQVIVINDGGEDRYPFFRSKDKARKERFLFGNRTTQKQKNKYLKILSGMYQVVACFPRHRYRGTINRGMGILEGTELLWT